MLVGGYWARKIYETLEIDVRTATKYEDLNSS